MLLKLLEPSILLFSHTLLFYCMFYDIACFWKILCCAISRAMCTVLDQRLGITALKKPVGKPVAKTAAFYNILSQTGGKKQKKKKQKKEIQKMRKK